MHLFVSQHPRWIFQQFVIVVETKLSLAVVEFVRITVVVVLECLVSSLIVVIRHGKQSD